MNIMDRRGAEGKTVMDTGGGGQLEGTGVWGNLWQGVMHAGDGRHSCR